MQGEEELARLQHEWSERHGYLLRLLRARSLRASSTAGLQRLAASLDFNGFYSGAAGTLR